MPMTITVEGMSCEHCERTIEEALEELPGVTEATADRDEAAATVEGTADEATLVDAVVDAGYEAAA